MTTVPKHKKKKQYGMKLPIQQSKTFWIILQDCHRLVERKGKCHIVTKAFEVSFLFHPKSLSFNHLLKS